MDPFLLRCLDLARLAGNQAAPNPLVGAVVVHDGHILGEGFHRRFGEAHAEVNAISAVTEKDKLPLSTLYVSLEPCNHWGKTPPCTELIVRSGIRRVVIGSLDPNPQVMGSGIRHLQAQGIEVSLAPDPKPFLALNRHFFLNQTRHRAWITLKWATSADGFIAKKNAEGRGQRTSISGEESQRQVHALRARMQAILIGKNTALIDDPLLNVRLSPGHDPLRIVLDAGAELPNDRRMFSLPGRTLILNTVKEETAGTAHWLRVPLAWFQDANALATGLYQQLQIGNVLVEGGARIHQFFMDADVFDELICIRSAQTLDDGIAGPRLPQGIALTSQENWGNDEVKRWLRG